MAQTPASSLTSYCSQTQLFERADARTLGDLMGDAGQRVDPVTLKTQATLGDLLLESSGEVEAAILVAQRYTVADLAVLNGASQQMLIGIVAWLTVGKVMDRRPGVTVPPEWEKKVESAYAKLQALAEGARIFAFAETAAAGLTTHDNEEPEDVEHRNLTSFELSRWLGRRNNRYPWG